MELIPIELNQVSSPFRKQQELGKDPKRDISVRPTESCSTKPNYSTESTSGQKTPLGLPFGKRKVEGEISPLHPSKKARDGINSPLTGSVKIKESKVTSKGMSANSEVLSSLSYKVNGFFLLNTTQMAEEAGLIMPPPPP